MTTPFPGMDPYLEQRGLWREVHTQLIVDMARALSPQIRPRYRVAIEQRSYMTVVGVSDRIAIPHIAVLAEPQAAYTTAAPAIGSFVFAELPMPERIVERYLEVRLIDTGEVITAIEVLSPTNKTTREGRAAYSEKRMNILAGWTNLVEIDLLRIGKPFEIRAAQTSSAYRIVVSRTWQRPRADLFAFGVRDAIPTIPVPLQCNDAEPLLELNAIVHALYESLSYDLLIDYGRPPDPPLSAEDAAWADALLRAQRLRV